MESIKIGTVQFSHSAVSNSVTPWAAAHQASPSITNSQSFLKLMPIETVMPFNHLILCRLLLLPSIFSNIRVFSNQSVLCIRWPKYWSFSFSISPSNEYSGLISFKEISHSLMVGIKLVQTIGGAIWCYPVKPKIYLPYNPGISFLGKSRETLLHVNKEISKNIQDSMFFKS